MDMHVHAGCGTEAGCQQADGDPRLESEPQPGQACPLLSYGKSRQSAAAQAAVHTSAAAPPQHPRLPNGQCHMNETGR